jgi:arylsulfatase
LQVDGKVVATKKLEHTMPITFPEDETFDVGMDTRTPVSLTEYQYDCPFKFTGMIIRLTFTLGPPEFVAPKP